nr:venom allergen (val) protein [Hymenolepis microstoma]
MKSYHLFLGILLFSVLVSAQFPIDDDDNCERYGCEECDCMHHEEEEEELREYGGDDNYNNGQEEEEDEEEDDDEVEEEDEDEEEEGRTEVFGMKDDDENKNDRNTSVSDDEVNWKKELLEMHNEFRRNVSKGLVSGQPGSNQLHDLVWNEELAKNASENSKTCTYGHTSRYEKDKIGQNIAYDRTIKEDFEQWTEGSSIYDYRLNECIFTWKDKTERYHFQNDCDHYKQLVSSKAVSVGCSRKWCKDEGYLLVCNYEPGFDLKDRPY